MDQEIIKVAGILRQGGIILYPTDTVWGIGCDATNAEAVEKIYALKHSVNKTSMLVMMDSVDMVARNMGKIPDVAWQLFELSDKPLTLVLPNAMSVAGNLIPEERTLGVRIPKHDFCIKLIRRLGRPVVSTSANISGQPAPSSFDGIDPAIKAGVDYIVPHRWEGNPTGRPSSIIQLGEGGQVKIIRE